MLRQLLLLVLVLFAITVVEAQRPVRPPRDTSAPAAPLPATAAIAGRVVDAESGAPIRRVTVQAMSLDHMHPIVVQTDDDGRYQFAGLEAGRWQLTASKTGFATQRLGQQRVFDPERHITLADGARADADFALVRASAINGRIYDEYGDPLPAVRVQVMRPRMIRQRRYLQRVGEGDLTDDTGAFRLYGLAPGEYYVAASLRVAPVDSVVQTTYAPTYYPGTADFGQAQRVLLAPGAEVNVDFPVLPFRAARVSGTVVTTSGAPADAFLSLTSEAGELGVPLGFGGVTREDGTFTIPEVPPGTYTLTASLKGGNTVGSEVASTPLTVYGDDVSGLTLVTAPPGRMRGTVVADAGVSRRLPPSVHIVARSTRAGADATYAESSKNTFRLEVPSGPFRLGLEPPEGWRVTALLVGDVDATDATLDIKGEQDVPLRVVLTDRLTSVEGSVSGAARAPHVLVFAEDSAKWTPPSRFVRSTTVDAQGRFTIAGLPPARYLAVAVDSLEEGEGDDPEFLARLRDRAVAFPLADGEVRALELTVTQR